MKQALSKPLKQAPSKPLARRLWTEQASGLEAVDTADSLGEGRGEQKGKQRRRGQGSSSSGKVEGAKVIFKDTKRQRLFKVDPERRRWRKDSAVCSRFAFDSCQFVSQA